MTFKEARLWGGQQQLRRSLLPGVLGPEQCIERRAIIPRDPGDVLT